MSIRAASCVIALALAFPVQAASIEFVLGASGQSSTGTAGQTAELTFQIDTDAALLNMPTSETQPHSFGGAGLIDMSLMIFDGGGGTLFDIDYAGDNSGLVDVQQFRQAGNMGVVNAGTNRLSVDLNAVDLTGVAVTTGFLNINLSSSTFLSFNQQATDFVANILFDDPTSLLSNAQLGLPIDIDNFDIVSDPGLIGINSSIVGNFLFDTISVTDVTPAPPPPPPNTPAVPLPAAGWFLIAGLGGLILTKSRRRAG